MNELRLRAQRLNAIFLWTRPIHKIYKIKGTYKGLVTQDMSVNAGTTFLFLFFLLSDLRPNIYK